MKKPSLILTLLGLHFLLILQCACLPSYLFNPNLKRLTSEPHLYKYPRWSPDGSKLAYVTTLIMEESTIYKMQSDGSMPRRLTEPGAESSTPDWSPDGNKLVFESVVNRVSRIAIMNADGTGITLINTIPTEAGCPKWSPDGKRIAFCGRQGGDIDTLQLYIMNPDGTDIRQLTDFPLGGIAEFEWSPDGKRIAFEAERIDEKQKTGGAGEFGPHLYVIDADGHNQAKIDNGYSGSFRLTWSPDGKYIFFRFTPRIYPGNKNFRNGGLYLMNADGTNWRMLLDEDCDYPHWSKISNRVVLTCGGNNYDGQIFVVDPNVLK